MSVIIGSNALCAAGRGNEQVWASVRAGISRIGSSKVLDRHLEAVQMGLVPEDALPQEFPPEIESLPLPSRARRMLRLGAPVLKSLVPLAGEPPIRLFLGLPQLSAAEAPWIKSFALHLAKLAGTQLDAPNSRVVPTGRAAALSALELALDAVQKDPTHRVIVGGIDTFLDLGVLATLLDEGRILGPRVMDGFIPGEGAAFMVLASEPPAGHPVPTVTVLAAGSASDPGHRGGTEPARGEGLAQAIDTLRSRLPSQDVKVATTFAGVNGESFDSRLWGIARVRHSDFFAPAMILEHPADIFGDAGAAAGAILTALAATALVKGHRPGPSLIWAASDGESRASALLSTTN